MGAGRLRAQSADTADFRHGRGLLRLVCARPHPLAALRHQADAI